MEVTLRNADDKAVTCIATEHLGGCISQPQSSNQYADRGTCNFIKVMDLPPTRLSFPFKECYGSDNQRL